jgi:hypothetical protein
MSRSDCKPLADAYDFAGLRKSILIPSGVEDASLRTDGPFAYRDLDDCMNLIQDIWVTCNAPTVPVPHGTFVTRCRRPFPRPRLIPR